MTADGAPPRPRASARDVARASVELQAATQRLIQALTAQLREPTPARAAEVEQLERERDLCHDRLVAAEESFAQTLRR